MKNLIRVLVVGLFAGTILGWWLAHEQQRREEEARSKAYANDPERLAIKKDRARTMQVDKWLEEFEDGDA
jgi:Na+/glutamate symporter